MKTMQFEKRGATTAAARAFYQQAIAIDPQYAAAMQGLATTYLQSWLEPSPDRPIGQEFEQQSVLDRAQALAEKAVEIDGTLPEAHATLGGILYWQNRLKDGIAEFERAFEFNPNLVDSRYAVLLIHGGRATDAIDYVKRMMRLDPFYPPQYTYFLGKGYFYVGRDEEALELIRSASRLMPGHRPSAVMLAAVAGRLGRNEEAHAAAAEVFRIQPSFTISSWLKWLRLVRQEDASRVAEGLRRAGLPD
jgi:adenylate cyclase